MWKTQVDSICDNTLKVCDKKTKKNKINAKVFFESTDIKSVNKKMQHYYK